jgi:hypothetical protein
MKPLAEADGLTQAFEGPAPAASLDPAPWPRRRWGYTVVASFLAQAALLLYFGEKPHPRVRPAQFNTAISLTADPWSEEQLARDLLWRDPTLLALPHPRGFSGEAWLHFTPIQHQPRDWTEPPRWLALHTDGLGDTLSRFLVTNIPAPLRIADKPLPRLMRSDPLVPNPPLLSRSTLRLEGDLARRTLRQQPELPSWPHYDVLANTVVELWVNAEGEPLVVTVRGESGLRAADEFASKLAAATRFQPVPRKKGSMPLADTLTWGRLVFRWHTLPPLTTNVPGGQP